MLNHFVILLFLSGMIMNLVGIIGRLFLSVFKFGFLCGMFALISVGFLPITLCFQKLCITLSKNIELIIEHD